MTETTSPAPPVVDLADAVHLTQADVAAFAAGIGKTVDQLTSDDFAALAAQHGGAIVVDQPVPVYDSLEAEHRAYTPPAGVPVRVPMLAFKLALWEAGVYTDVAAAAKNDPLAEIYWISAENAERGDDRVIRIALGFGWPPSRLDDVFTLAGAKAA